MQVRVESQFRQDVSLWAAWLHFIALQGTLLQTALSTVFNVARCRELTMIFINRKYAACILQALALHHASQWKIGKARVEALKGERERERGTELKERTSQW